MGVCSFPGSGQKQRTSTNELRTSLSHLLARKKTCLFQLTSSKSFPFSLFFLESQAIRFSPLLPYQTQLPTRSPQQTSNPIFLVSFTLSSANDVYFVLFSYHHSHLQRHRSSSDSPCGFGRGPLPQHTHGGITKGSAARPKRALYQYSSSLALHPAKEAST